MAKDSQGVDGMSGKLVAQASLPASAASTVSDDKQTYQAPRTSGTITNRDSMCLVTSACPPGNEPHGKSRS